MAYADPEEQRAYSRRYYAENSARIKGQVSTHNKRYRERNRIIAEDAKSKPCMDCGGEFPPYVMQFDHRDEKTNNVSMMVWSGGVSEATLRAEIALCDVVCANCHCIRTHKRRQGIVV